RLSWGGVYLRQLEGRAFRQLPAGVERDGEPLRGRVRGRIDRQRGGARRVGREAGQIARDDPGGGEGASQPRERGTFERAPRHAEQLQGGGDVGDGLGANRVVGEEEGGELGHLRERGADGGGIGRGGATRHAGGAERPGGVRRHPLQRGR